MTIALGDNSTPATEAVTGAAVSPRSLLVAGAGVTSLGAGAIHAAAIGVHADVRPAAIAFAALAAVQLCWGGVALVRSTRPVVLSGLVLGVGSVAAWVLAKTVGIGFIDGLGEVEPVQYVDALAAALAFASVALLAVSLKASDEPGLSSQQRMLAPFAGLAVAALATSGMVSVSGHHHAGGHDETVTAGDHHGTDDHGATPAATGEHDMAAMASSVAPVAYDPTKPIDLGGVEGVTPEEQAAAENLVAVTLLRLPQWKDSAVAEAAGFSSIGDGRTGTEHLINQAFIDDDTILDPDKPESLVYDTTKGGRTLVAAMFMVKPGTPLSDVPHLGGKLTQWHVHENLCYRPDGKLGGLTDAAGNCAKGLTKPPATPMIHVWITSHKCGPFAALDGIGGGTIAAGEERLCDVAHGGHGGH
jgi:hypothetical protein